jgi:hypothetical protein
MDRDQFFNNLFDDDKFNYQQSYENRAVRRVITECGITPVSWGKLVNQCRDETGLPYFSFHWFNGFFPDFPAKLCGKRIGWCGKILDGSGGYKKVGLYELPLHEILRPKNNLLLRSISNNLEQFEVADDEKFVFLFSLARKMFCAHNLAVEADGSQPSIRWLFQHEGRSLTVEASASFFKALGSEWYQERD